MEASVNRMHNLERRCIFSQGLEILTVSGSYFIFKIILSLFLVIGRGGGRVPNARIWWLAETGWRCCHVGAWSMSTNKLERNKPVIVLLSVTEGPKWCGCDERGAGRKKKRRRTWVLWTQKQLVNSVRFSLVSNGLIRSLILSQMTPQGTINSLFYPLKMRHQSNHF